jgi:hypothetical protein
MLCNAEHQHVTYTTRLFSTRSGTIRGCSVKTDLMLAQILLSLEIRGPKSGGGCVFLLKDWCIFKTQTCNICLIGILFTVMFYE